jgi:hypothetical protein
LNVFLLPALSPQLQSAVSDARAALDDKLDALAECKCGVKCNVQFLETFSSAELGHGAAQVWNVTHL